jgi:HlyD family secretion protein
MTIPANSVIGLVGASGSGKSTAIDLLLGLLTPQKGELCIDGTSITESNKRAWQNTIGFVPQSIFLSEGTIAENVAFGLPVKVIDLEQVKKAIQLAHLTELVEQLPNGLDTKVGERGVQLSGGQRQRIGIARALYNEADVLVFDEATSALDGITEKIIMEAIHDFSGQKTIIMIAHRLKTVQKCDTIYLMEQGQITAQGTYDELVANNAQFKEMAAHA